MHLRRSAVATVLAMALAAAVPAAAVGSPPDQSAAPTPAALEPAAKSATSELVTLVTGDRVQVRKGTDGRAELTVEPADRDVEVWFDTYTRGDQSYVVPSDAAALIPAVLDRELFNVTKLAEHDYRDAVPVIVDYRSKAARARAATPRGAKVTAQLTGLDLAAAKVDRNGQWWQAARVASGKKAASVRAAAGGPLSEVSKVWLDEVIEPALDGTVRQIGAPEAWAAGYDGSGMKVAVLDTGVDPGHPDLQNKVIAAQDFTGGNDPGDRHGHGTHVATTIAGTGAASGGKYTGVAPKAQVLNGKVCEQAGCPLSAILQGMQWAAAEGAEVINMSLGGGASDGTDILSQAVNVFTQDYGALFVVAAGNSGQFGDYTVEAPGTADAALTVGAVDRTDRLADFSGRGPRVGNYAIKPDITAPGVGIVAGRASGTTMGTPVGDHYTTASGTSMATPHVAGAAALVAQQNPDLSPAQLKALLATTAVVNNTLDVYQQGGGRVDLRRALDADVVANRSPLNLGYFTYPHDNTAPVSSEISYTNRTDKAVTIELDVNAGIRNGTSAGDDMLAVSPASLTIEAGATANATVTLDVRVGDAGIYGGYLTASQGGAVVSSTPVGFYKEAETYELRVEAIARDGRPAVNFNSAFDVLDVADTARFLSISNTFVDGVATLRVPAGTYSVTGIIYSTTGDSATDRAWVGDPELEISADTKVVLDARKANPVKTTTPQPTKLVGSTIGWWRESESGGPFAHSHIGGDIPQSAVETEPVTRGKFELYTRERHVAGAQGSILYDLVVPHSTQVPADLTYVADPAKLARVDNRFHGDVAGTRGLEVRHFFRPWSVNSSGMVALQNLPLERTEYVVADDTCYAQWAYAKLGYQGEVREPTTCYKPGERRSQNWMRQVARPGVMAGSPLDPGEPTTRSGNTVTLSAYPWQDSAGHHGYLNSSSDTAAIRVYEDGKLIGEGNGSRGTIEVSPKAAEHRVELDLTRQADWWTTSTETHTAWTIQSKGSTAEQLVLPLLEVDYDVAVDLLNTSARPSDRRGANTLGLTVRHQPGADGPAITDAKLSVSYDDGKTWTKRPVKWLGNGRFKVILDNPDPADTNGFAAVKVEARDAGNNRIEQTVIRAWKLPTAR